MPLPKTTKKIMARLPLLEGETLQRSATAARWALNSEIMAAVHYWNRVEECERQLVRAVLKQPNMWGNGRRMQGEREP